MARAPNKPIPELTAAEASRFWSRAVRLANGCLVWTGGLSHEGYGVVYFRRVPYGAHRVAWRLVTGRDPAALHVLHECDEPACLEHLFLGTHAANMADMAAKGRADRLRKARGEQHYRAKLTEATIAWAREQRSHGATFSAIARALGVHRITISDALSGRKWTHLNRPETP